MISSWRRKSAARKGMKKLDSGKSGSTEVVIPSHFRCPISLDLMKDPVTMSTGITYDRKNIETWIDVSGNHTCPVTNQLLKSLEPVPNHAIRKMIQEWCVENKSMGIERIPTPRIPMNSSQAFDILSRLEAGRMAKDGERCREVVRKIKTVAKESEKNRRCMAESGACVALSATFEAFSDVCLKEQSSINKCDHNIEVLEELILALTTMISFLDKESMSYLGSPQSLRCMVLFLLRFQSLSGRANAVLLLQQILSSNPLRIDEFSKIEGAMEGLIKLIKEPISSVTTKASLLCIYHMVHSSPSSFDSTIPGFVEMNLVTLLLELLVDSERSVCEKALGVLDCVVSCDQGMKSAHEHALTVPVLVKKLLRVTDLATEFSVSILWKLTKDGGGGIEGGVLGEALKVGAFQKLLLLLQVGCSDETREKVSELLKLMNLQRNRLMEECIDSADFKNLKRPF